MSGPWRAKGVDWPWYIFSPGCVTAWRTRCPAGAGAVEPGRRSVDAMDSSDGQPSPDSPTRTASATDRSSRPIAPGPPGSEPAELAKSDGGRPGSMPTVAPWDATVALSDPAEFVPRIDRPPSTEGPSAHEAPAPPSPDPSYSLGEETSDGHSPPAPRRRAAPAPRPRGGRAAPVIDGYEILGELGRGGMGVFYHARQVRLTRPCALKMILAGAHADSEANVRFLAEAETVARLQHPHVVQ